MCAAAACDISATASAGGALSAATRLREKLRVRGTSLTAQLDSALREAKSLAKTDTGGAVNAAERAVFLAIELKLGLKARAILKSELARELSLRAWPRSGAPRAMDGYADFVDYAERLTRAADVPDYTFNWW